MLKSKRCVTAAAGTAARSSDCRAWTKFATFTLQISLPPAHHSACQQRALCRATDRSLFATHPD